MNAFTRKPNISDFVTSAQKSYVTSTAATRTIAKAPSRSKFVICPDNPRHNPLATLEEKQAWQQKKLSRIG